MFGFLRRAHMTGRHGMSLQLRRFTDVEKPVSSIAYKDFPSCRETDTLDMIVETMVNGRHKRVAVLGSDGGFRGTINDTDILNYLGTGGLHKLFSRYKNPLSITADKIMRPGPVPIGKNRKLSYAVDVFKRQKKSAYPVTDGKKLLGMISERCLTRLVNKSTGIKVREIMVKPMTAREGYTLFETAKIMERTGYRRLPVVRKNILVGVITPYDIISYLRKNRRVAALRTDATPISRVMNKQLITASPKEDISAAVERMQENRIGFLPVEEEGEAVGILTQRDIIDAIK